MTQPAHPTSASSSKTVENTLSLGEVQFQGRTYMAILHYYGNDGEEREITQEMKSAQEAYRKTIQEILTLAEKSGNDVPTGLLDRVTSGGLIFVSDEEEESFPIPTHQQLKTEEAWKRFLFILNIPALASVSKSHVQLEDITDLNNRSEELYKSIEQKFDNSSEKEKVELASDEQRWLRLHHYPHLAQGIYNRAEYADFKSLETLYVEDL